MKKPISAVVLTIVVGALVATPAAGSAGTQVKITSWKVKTSDGNVHKAKPGDTVKVCASHPADDLLARAKVDGAKKGKAYGAAWSADGKPMGQFSEHWLKGGSFRTTFGIGAEGFQPATYKLKLVESSKTIGTSDLTLKTKKGC